MQGHCCGCSDWGPVAFVHLGTFYNTAIGGWLQRRSCQVMVLVGLGKTLPVEARVCIGTTQEFTKRFVHPAEEKDPEATRQLMKRFSGQSARGT